MNYYIGIDIGGTNVKFAIIDELGEVHYKSKVPTQEVFSVTPAYRGVINIINQLLEIKSDIAAVGIGFPGTLSEDKKEIVSLNNIPALNGWAFVETLEKTFPQLSFYGENDANVAALGQYVFANQKEGDFLFLTLGTGVGASLILNGDIFSGSKGNALEIHNNPCKGGYGYEYFLGKKGWVRQYQEMTRSEEIQITPKELFKLAKNGDKVALKLFKKQGRLLGELIVSAIRYFDIRDVYIGGGVGETFELMEKSCLKSVSKYMDEYYTGGLKIEVSSLKNKAGMKGAVALCVLREKDVVQLEAY